MKYGLLVYKDTENIGDDIQSYVAKRFLPQIDYYVEREELDTFFPDEKEKVSIIMNGWFLHKKYNFPPTDYINPLLISMHFATGNKWTLEKKRYLENFTKEYLNKEGPVGARDISTLEKLNSVGINSYFSGCMTLTISKFDFIKSNEEYVCAVDLCDETYNKLFKYTNLKIIRKTHKLNKDENSNLTYEKRFENVERLLKLYQGAKFVVTTRLHCVLPCLALGVPVILLYDDDSINRLGTYKSLLTIGTEKDFIEGTLELEFKDNKGELLKIRNDLITRCEKFIEDSRHVTDNELMEIVDYKETNKIDYILWKKEIMTIEMEDIKRDLYSAQEYIKELEVRNGELEREVEQLNEKISHIKNRKLYKMIDIVDEIRGDKNSENK